MGESRDSREFGVPFDHHWNDAEISRLQAQVAELRLEIDQLRKIADSKVVEVRDFEIARQALPRHHPAKPGEERGG